MQIETKRLLLFPLPADLLHILLTDMPEFERKTAYQYDGEELSGELYTMFKGQVDLVRSSGANYVWHTFWMISRKEDNKIIGSACYKNEPTAHGSVEIGYGLNLEYERKGYMTEAVSALVEWALLQPNVAEVVAEVEKNNIPSQRVLQKNGFLIYKTVEPFDWYRITKSNEGMEAI